VVFISSRGNHDSIHLSPCLGTPQGKSEKNSQQRSDATLHGEPPVNAKDGLTSDQHANRSAE
jgi:hypothetical protein